MTETLHDSIVSGVRPVMLDGKSSYISRDSLRTIVEEFFYNQFRHIQDPEVPTFVFISKDARLAMGLGGVVRMRGWFDWGGAIPANGFIPTLIPMNPDPTKMRKFGTTPAGTCLYFRIVGHSDLVRSYQLYIEANFNGWNGLGFNLKQAYAMVNSWTIGYTNSTFSDPAAVSPTVDAQGPNNKLSNNSVLVRYMPRLGKHLLLAVSAETPATQIDADGVDTKGIDNFVPDGAAFIQYDWGYNRAQHVRLAGIVRSLAYRDMLSKRNHYKAGWGLQLSAVTHPIKELTTYTTVNYGHGYAGLTGDLMLGAYDLVSHPDKPGELYAPASMGWSVGLQYNFRPELFTSVTVSENVYIPDDSMPGTEYKRGWFGCVNVFWNLTPRIQVGAEYDLGSRVNFDGAHRLAHRVGALCQFAF
ncbi:MAG: hypothetical protein K2M79_01785 [Muribaculaceae bacterium]|nr:hypothetical protein [Muribaculaceae bacterium]